MSKRRAMLVISSSPCVLNVVSCRSPPKRLFRNKNGEKFYSADAAGVEVDSIAVLCSALLWLVAGARLECIAGEWVT